MTTKSKKAAGKAQKLRTTGRPSHSQSAGSSLPVGIGLKSTTPISIDIGEELLSFRRHPIPLPAILYIPGMVPGISDPNALSATAPEIASALRSQSLGVEPAGNHTPHAQYWLCREVEENHVLAWPIISGGDTLAEKTSFLGKVSQSARNTIIPLDEESAGLFPNPLHPSSPSRNLEAVAYRNPAVVSDQASPLQGFLVTSVNSVFDVENLVCVYHAHSFSIDPFQLHGLERYVNELAGPRELDRTMPGGEHESKASVGVAGLAQWNETSSESLGGLDGSDWGADDSFYDGDSGDPIEELRFLAGLGGSHGDVFSRAADKLQEERDEEERQDYVAAQEQVASYVAGLVNVEENPGVSPPH
ncbi:hypothetical protein DFH06DRAFT_1323993 [Mycena polygramma]|nr:hypothetical protein DFH06DRAFT_1323993 [Mycena polygramma]